MRNFSGVLGTSNHRVSNIVDHEQNRTAMNTAQAKAHNEPVQSLLHMPLGNMVGQNASVTDQIEFWSNILTRQKCAIQPSSYPSLREREPAWYTLFAHACAIIGERSEPHTNHVNGDFWYIYRGLY